MPRPYELAVYPLPARECKVYDCVGNDQVERVLRPKHTARVGEIGARDTLRLAAERDRLWALWTLVTLVVAGGVWVWAVGVGG
ncbi:MAG: hypothetical protein ABFE07_17130 [Armatimonadia bacterium]